MKPASKYLSIVSLVTVIAFGLLWFLANTHPNMEMVIVNNSHQAIASIELKMGLSGKNIRLRGIDVGTEVTVRFHSDSTETVSSFVRFSDGKEIRSDGVSIEPGFRVIASVTEDNFMAQQGQAMDAVK